MDGTPHFWIGEFCIIWIVVQIVVRIMELSKFWIVVWLMGRFRFWIVGVFVPIWIVKGVVRHGLQWLRKVEFSAVDPPACMQQEFVDLAEISIRESPIDHLRSSYPNGKVKGSGILKHDYIVIKLASSDSFVVEKVADPVQCGILSCEYAMLTIGEEQGYSGHNCRFKADLKGARVRVQDLIYIVQAEGHECKLMSNNCWAYAYFTAEKVIKLCEKAANLSDADRKSVQRVFRSLEEKRRIVPRSLFSFFLSLSLFYLLPKAVSTILYRPRLCFLLIFSSYLTKIGYFVLVLSYIVLLRMCEIGFWISCAWNYYGRDVRSGNPLFCRIYCTVF